MALEEQRRVDVANGEARVAAHLGEGGCDLQRDLDDPDALKLVARTGTPGRFVEAEQYAAPDALTGERVDPVCTGVGAIGWLPDLRGWGRVDADLPVPGGRLIIRDALLDAGPRLDALAEHDRVPWQAPPQMVEVEGGDFALPDGRERLPLMVTIVATRPALSSSP